MKKILVIDDDPSVQKLFSMFLGKKGYQIQVADNGKIGMDLMERDQPDLIITDILMPEMDGLEILLKIRKTRADLPVIAISGGSRALPINFLKQASLFGAKHVFEKPVPLNVLNETVRDLLGENPAPPTVGSSS
ncbi:response regulator [Pontiella sp.]|uniref:response regulator n=1 Tax=Pontiella sp. TaxID=2837462 RepID=UPI003567BF85